MKKYLMLWLLGLTLFLASSFWLLLMSLSSSGNSGSGGSVLVVFCFLVHLVGIIMSIYAAACGAFDAAREEIKRREQEKNKVS